jgi:uncharacterized surface protein with fasciclin (FAS1) repeats
MHRKNICFLLVLFFITAGLTLPACKKTEIKMSTTDDVNIVGYLDNHKDSFSLFREILERTENAAFLNAYGAYTCFAPTNSGVKAWLAANNAANVAAANIDLLKDMVKFHILTDTITTSAFKDGKLPVPTMYGQYLVTGVHYENGTSGYIINRQALVTTSNIKVGNGNLHVINKVLVPAKTSLVAQLEANPNYSIFVQAIKETGFYDKLNTVDPDTSKRWMTLMAESNKALADSGITSYAALKARYSKTGNPADPNDSLRMYVAYHILDGVKFLGDIISSPSHQTFQPQEVISIQLINQQVVVNEDEFNGVMEKGVTLTRVSSDNAATNGVWHDAGAHYSVKYRKPTAIFWELSAFPEILKMPAYYQKQGYTWTRLTESENLFRDFTWGWGKLASTNIFTYSYSKTSSISRYAVNNDINQLPLGLPNRPTWWEMKTPPVIKGKYKIWICYSRHANANPMLCQITVNGEMMPRTLDFNAVRPKGTDAELEAIGWKQYTEPRAYNTDSNYAAKLAGIFEFKTTERQTIRLTAIGTQTQNTNYLDMIHIIPVDENQIWPKFRMDGSKVYQ